jgi:hypothetical protein
MAASDSTSAPSVLRYLGVAGFRARPLRRLAARLLGRVRPDESSSEWIDTLADLAIGEAVLLRALPEEARELTDSGWSTG